MNFIRIVRKFKANDSVNDLRSTKSGRTKTVVTEQNAKRVRALYSENPDTSIMQASQQLDISSSSMRTILRTELKFKPYKIILNQPLTEAAKFKRFEFANLLTSMAEIENFNFNKIWFSDEAHFTLKGYLNKQNNRYWWYESFGETISVPLHSEKITVWCALSATGIIGPYLFDSTIKSSNYSAMIRDFFVPKIRKLRKLSKWSYMQDGARPHRTFEVFDILKEHFNGRLIALDSKSYTGNGIDWPPYSPDLNPLDFFLWGYLKDKIYKGKPETLLDVEKAVRSEIRKIKPDLLKRVIDSFRNRLYKIIVTEGAHFEYFK